MLPPPRFTVGKVFFGSKASSDSPCTDSSSLWPQKLSFWPEKSAQEVTRLVHMGVGVLQAVVEVVRSMEGSLASNHEADSDVEYAALQMGKLSAHDPPARP